MNLAIVFKDIVVMLVFCSYEYDLNTVIDDYINNLHASEAVGTTAAKGTLQALRKNVYNMSQDLLNIFEIIKKLYVIYNQHTNKNRIAS